MKRFKILFLAVLISIVPLQCIPFVITPSFGFVWSISSGAIASSQAVYAYPGYISAIVIKTDGTEDVAVIVYDNASAGSGKKLYESTIKGSDNYGGRTWVFPAKADNGLYVAITTSGTTVVIIEYIPLR